ncbi:unnamed protein product [Prorocentrum cordatum]|uniref:Uncharacterized protein n=1 Tax=Prorocentrum cordatum TaxID=2364126 RepID=A0ABN9RFC6_9DINO|nr:unnamed protein product [Polarella glacialis]
MAPGGAPSVPAPGSPASAAVPLPLGLLLSAHGGPLAAPPGLADASSAAAPPTLVDASAARRAKRERAPLCGPSRGGAGGAPAGRGGGGLAEGGAEAGLPKPLGVEPRWWAASLADASSAAPPVFDSLLAAPPGLADASAEAPSSLVGASAAGRAERERAPLCGPSRGGAGGAPAARGGGGLAEGGAEAGLPKPPGVEPRWWSQSQHGELLCPLSEFPTCCRTRPSSCAWGAAGRARTGWWTASTWRCS